MAALLARTSEHEPICIDPSGLDASDHCHDGARLRGFLASWPGHACLYPVRRKAEILQEGCQFDTSTALCSSFKRERSAAIAVRIFRTGNVAFDDWREAELARLEEERRKLDEMREQFDNYVRELRRAKDQEEFDRFMRDRNSGGSGSVPGFPAH